MAVQINSILVHISGDSEQSAKYTSNKLYAICQRPGAE